MIGTIIIFLLIFFVIVMGHEFGHFLIAKVNGIRVNEFAIGMGPKIAGFKKGETEYALRAFPLGGACIFEGEDGLEAAKEEASAAGTPADKTGRGALRNVPVDVDRGNFQNAPVWSRIATVFAGPLFNFLLAFIFAIMVAGYAGADLPVLGSVVEGSAAEAAGMQAGDKILRFNSKINLAREISLEMALNKTGEPVKVVYERDGQEYETTLTPIYNEEAGKYLVGFQNYASYDEAKGTKLFRYAWYQLRFCIKNSVLSVKSLVEGKLSKNDVAGPVGMAQIVDQVKTAAEPGETDACVHEHGQSGDASVSQPGRDEFASAARTGRWQTGIFVPGGTSWKTDPTGKRRRHSFRGLCRTDGADGVCDVQ